MREEAIGKYVSINFRMMHKIITRDMEQFGLSMCHVMYLIKLHQYDGLNQDDLKRFVEKDKGTTARALKKLADLGYIRREKNEKDKRAYKIYLTDEGKALMPTLFEILDKNEKINGKGITPEEKETALRVLKVMSQNYKEYIEEEMEE